MRAITRCGLVALVLIGCVACDQTSAFLSLGDSLPPAIRYDGLVIGVGAFVIALLAWAVLSTRLAWWQRIAIAAVGAGGASNLIDRLRFEGAVTDFLNLGIGPLRTGIFNIADVILTLGLVLLVLGWNRHSPAGRFHEN